MIQLKTHFPYSIYNYLTTTVTEIHTFMYYNDIRKY